MSHSFCTCRFCGKSAHDHWLVKYGVRHYAHTTCYLNAGKKVEDLSQHERDQFEQKNRDWTQLVARRSV